MKLRESAISGDEYYGDAEDSLQRLLGALHPGVEEDGISFDGGASDSDLAQANTHLESVLQVGHQFPNFAHN